MSKRRMLSSLWPSHLPAQTISSFSLVGEQELWTCVVVQLCGIQPKCGSNKLVSQGAALRGDNVYKVKMEKLFKSKGFPLKEPMGT